MGKKLETGDIIFIVAERQDNIKAGDLLSCGATVVDTRYARQGVGAIGVEWRGPEFENRARQAVKSYVDAYRQDQLRQKDPQTPFYDRIFD